MAKHYGRGLPKLPEDAIRAIRAAYAAAPKKHGMFTTLARRYNVAGSTVRLIVDRKVRADVSDQPDEEVHREA